jgi:hypothetical protein
VWGKWRRSVGALIRLHQSEGGWLERLEKGDKGRWAGGAEVVRMAWRLGLAPERMGTGRKKEWTKINNGLRKSFSDLNQGFEFKDSMIQILSN